ncbi:saccharopine dehydrogenase NADP-binding domain-containing protein [Gorillibacterium sp. CAU 1737]|uniref:saccharopine dehydrogenase family protein n=1 Tax=Gorillibacterium sp. CAU 1737 TaxID=3140362 RepID=UPI0032600BED
MDRIVVVGGYGQVGQMICRELGERYPGRVVAAGRSLEKAERFSRSTNGKVMPMRLDVGDAVVPEAMRDVKVIIMCLDQADVSFVRSCIRLGIDYLDISADYSFLSRLEELQPEAEASGAVAVRSVGLSPGLTNVLARHAASMLDRTDKINLSIMLGLGDQHGQAAIEWTVRNLNRSYKVLQHGREVLVSSFTDGAVTDFGDGLGRRKAYRFNFADQHALARTLSVPEVATRLCFDGRITTGLVRLLRAIGALHVLRFDPVQRLAVKLFGANLPLGRELFAVKVDAWGIRDGAPASVECLVRGEREAEVTARVTAAAAGLLLDFKRKPGVYHLEQVCSLEELLPSIEPLITLKTST